MFLYVIDLSPPSMTNLVCVFLLVLTIRFIVACYDLEQLIVIGDVVGSDNSRCLCEA